MKCKYLTILAAFLMTSCTGLSAGWKAQKSGDYDEAMKQAAIALAKEPKNPNAEATFYDCYNHYERYTHPMQYDCPVLTPEAKKFWDEKTKSTERFVEQYRKDILFGGENYIGYR